MFWSECSHGSLWWLFPLIMIALCFFIMRGRKSSIMSGFGSRAEESHPVNTSESAMDILDNRYALGEIECEEYEEKKRTINS